MTPKPDQSRSSFIASCMGDSSMKDIHPQHDRRLCACQKAWDKRELNAMLSAPIHVETAEGTKVYAFEVDETGLAKWPLSFREMEKDFKRPNKPADKPAQDPVNLSKDTGEEDKPFQTGTPI